MKLKKSLVNLLTVLVIISFANLFATNPPPTKNPPENYDSPESYFYSFIEAMLDGLREGQSQQNTCGCGSGSEECPCDNNDPNNPDSIRFNLSFGKPLYATSITNPALFFIKDKPTPTIFSPQGLRYSLNLNTYVFKDETEDLEAGVAREVTIVRPNGYGIIYRFLDGESTGFPIGDQSTFRSKLQMTDANGDPVTENPTQYKRIFDNGSYAIFSKSTKLLVSITNPKGETITPGSAAVGIEILKEGFNLRQIYSKTDGLADIVVVNDYKYEIRLYNHADVGAKDGSGFYTVSGTPREVWSIENPEQSDTVISKVRITQTLASGPSYVFDWEYVEASNMWKVTSGGGVKTTSLSILKDTSGTYSQTVEQTVDATSQVVSKKITNQQKFPFGLRKILVVNDPEGVALTTTYSYYDDDSETGKYGQHKSTQNPNGSWETFDYDTQGRMTVKVMAYKDSAFGSEAGSAKAMYFSYASLDTADVPLDNDNRPRTETTKILGTTVAKTFYVYKTVGGEYVEIEERAASPGNSYGNAANYRITKTYYAATAGSPSAGRIKTIAASDDTLKTYTYELGTYAVSPTPGSSTFTAGTGDALRTTIVNGTSGAPAGIANKSTKEIMVQDELGNNVLNETYAYDGSGYSRIAWNERVFNDEHKVTASYHSNNTQSNATWNCCSKDSETTADGTEYVYSYNLLKQMVTRTKKGHSGTADIVTTYTYDVEGRRLSSSTAAGSLTLATSATYDVVGRMLTSTDVSGLTTTYAYTNGGRTVTITSKGATTVSDKYLDGRIKSVTGSAVIPRYYYYDIDGSGNQVTTVYTAVDSGPRYVKTTVDALGRVIKTESPAFGGGTVVAQNTYNNKSQLIKTTQTGLADTLYEYDELSNVIRSGLDVDGNGSLTLASTDRISDSDTVFSNESGTWYQKTTGKTYATDSDATATTTGISKRQLTGLASGVTSKTISTDINGNTTTSTTSIDRTNKTVTQTTDVPDSTVDAVSITVNGLLTSQKTAQNLTYSYTYDTLGRRTGVTDPRTGASTTAYYASGAGKTGKVYTVTDAASNTTTFDYSSTTGRRTKVTNALSKDTEYFYNTRGQVIGVSGPATYPLGYVYGTYGEMSELHTYRDGLTPDKTIWTYDSATGLLTSKKDANNKSVSYTYDSSNRLATRTWARLDGTNPLTTTYSYNASTGELTSVDYSDSTPDIAYTYNRLGQQKTVADAVGTRTFAYNSALQPLTETITGLYSKTIIRSYEITGVVGRYTGVNIGTEYDVDYGYDTLGRFSTVTNGSDVYTYNYLTNSNLVSSITYPNNISVTNAYESNRNLIDYVENKHNTTTISKYNYTNDALGRRTAMEKSGTAFSVTDTINYSYNDKSEVTGADAVTDANYNFGFDYDTIGNRKTYDTTESGSNVQSVYSANNLNQYTNITNPTQSPTYDDDGNMLTMTLASGSWTNTFNAENRIIAQEKSDARLEYVYDYMGRRVEKKVYSGSPGSWTLDEHKRFVYDNYKLIEELDGADSNAIDKEFVWRGEKILSITDNDLTATYYYLHDANKNVGQLLDGSGSIVAKYEYSPFGKVTSSGGSYKDDNPFRFSSEYADSETGLVYYNYRYYSAELGRWLSRDPIAIIGSTSWWAGNPERIELKKALRRLEELVNNLYASSSKKPFSLATQDELLSSLKKQILFLQYELNLDLLGKRNNGNNDNPYNHTGNNPINNWDYNGEFALVIVLGGVTIGVVEIAGISLCCCLLIPSCRDGLMDAIKELMRKAGETIRKFKGHRKNKRPSNKRKHDKGQRRRGRDKGGEKGDARRHW